MPQLKDVAIKVEGVWLPKHEQHMLDWMTVGKAAHRENGKITYQWQKQQKARQLADRYKPDWQKMIFVDVGAHCGFWSMWWGQKAAGLIAYEPIPVHRQILEANCKANGVNWNNACLVAGAVSDEADLPVSLKWNPTNTGASRVLPEANPNSRFPPVETRTVTLDGTLPDLLGTAAMGVLKIDAEGFEEKVILGGVDVIRKHKPFVIVEQRMENRQVALKAGGAVGILQKWGYRVLKEISGDHFMAVT